MRLHVRQHAALGLPALALVLLIAILVADEPRVRSYTIDSIDSHHLRALEIDSAAELEALFASLSYHWPPPDHARVPPVVIKRLPADFPAITQTEQRKSLFLRLLLPIVLLENRRIREQRVLAQWLLNNGLMAAGSRAEGSPEHVWLTSLARRLQVKGSLRDPSVQALLLRRLDEIPPALALAQGAMESGWGTSRFALEGNSLFGQWTYQANAGLEPNNRAPDATHLVASFPDLRASVRAYMRNLNSSRAYREFREAREVMREAGLELSPTKLAGHLQRYSGRGMEYVEELRVIINSSTLAALPAEAEVVPPLALLTETGTQPTSAIR